MKDCVIYRAMHRALHDFRLIDDGDKVLIGLSGGKDSLCLLEMLAARQKIFFPRFTAEAIHIRMENVAYESDTAYLEEFASAHGVPLHIITTSFVEEKEGARHKPACFLCSWQRRKMMFNFAQQHGFNKIALGHHQDDVINTAMMNLVFQGQFSSIPPMLKMDKMPLSIIRPFYYVKEEDIRTHAESAGYQQQKKLCPHEKETNRQSVKELFEMAEKLNPDARNSISHAILKTVQ